MRNENVENEKDIRTWFETGLPAAFVQTKRNIFKATWEVSWPMPPQPLKHGAFLSWNSYLTTVEWKDELIDLLIRSSGAQRVKEVVLACRTQTEADRFCEEFDCALGNVTETEKWCNLEAPQDNAG